MKNGVEAIKAGLFVTSRGTTVPLAAKDFAEQGMWNWLLESAPPDLLTSYGLEAADEDYWHKLRDNADDIVVHVRVESIEGLPPVEATATASIKAALHLPVTAAEPAPAPAPATTKKEPLQPVDLTQKIEKGKPTDISYKDFRVMPLEAADLVVASFRALRERYKRMLDINTQLKSIQTIADTQKAEFREKEGEPQLIKEINDYKEKFGQAIEELNAEMPTILESGDVLMGIVETLETGKVTPTQKMAILQEIIKQEVPEKVKDITAKFNEAVNKAGIAGDAIIRTFKMWHPSKTYRQEVKEYHTKSSIKQADIMESLKGAGEKLLNMMKGAWETVSDAVSSFLVDADDTKAAIDSVVQVAKEQGVEV